MTDIVDISVALKAPLPLWPGSVGFRLTRTLRLEAGDPANVSRLDCDIHVGTHLDVPRHFLQHGITVDQVPLATLVGTAVVADLPDVPWITAADLERLALPAEVPRLLLRTRNSRLWTDGVTEFRPDYVALTEDAARWVVARGMRLVGIDYLSIQRYQDGPAVHQILLGSGVIILEGLNLADAAPGVYELVCLPLRLIGAEGAPARAILRPLAALGRGATD